MRRLARQQQIPSGVGLLAEPGVGRRPLVQTQDGGTADGLVGVWSGDDEASDEAARAFSLAVPGYSVASRNVIVPKPTWSPSRTNAAPITRRPLTVVPLVEPRSRSTHRPPW